MRQAIGNGTKPAGQKELMATTFLGSHRAQRLQHGFPGLLTRLCSLTEHKGVLQGPLPSLGFHIPRVGCGRRNGTEQELLSPGGIQVPRCFTSVLLRELSKAQVRRQGPVLPGQARARGLRVLGPAVTGVPAEQAVAPFPHEARSQPAQGMLRNEALLAPRGGRETRAYLGGSDADPGSPAGGRGSGSSRVQGSWTLWGLSCRPPPPPCPRAPSCVALTWCWLGSAARQAGSEGAQAKQGAQGQG